MKIKIEIKTKGKERTNPDIVNRINEVMEEIGYINTSFKEYRICDGCDIRLPADYPKEEDLCPNCKSGKQDAIKDSV